MAANDIKIELQLDGEKQFNQALKSCNQELKAMQSGVKAVDAANRGAANSQEALEKKVKALGETAQSAKNKVKTLTEIVTKQRQAQLEAARAVEAAKEKYGEGSKEVEKAENSYRIATDAVNKWQTKLNEAQVEQQAINDDLKKHEGYLEEAKNSTDKCAKSIDEYGKATKDADTDTQDLHKTVAKTSAMEAMDKVCKTLEKTLGALGDKALDAAKELDKGYDSIVKKTGATGTQLEKYKDIANDIFGDLPETMDDVGDAVGEVSTRFKQSGDQLKKTSEQFVKFAKINEVNVSDAIDDVQVSMSAFNVETKDVNRVLDVLTRTGQNTGAKVGQLASKITQNATAFQEMGMNIYQAIDFMGKLEVAGADAESVLSGMKRALKNATEQGVPFKDALADLEDTIKNGTGSMDGLTAAYDLFGKSGAGIYEAVKNGQISFTDLADSTDILADSTDALTAAYEGTLSGWDKMTVATNNLKIAGSELTEKFFEAASPAIDGLTGFVKDLTKGFSELPDEVQTVIGVIGGVGTIAAKVVPEIMNFVTQLATLKAMRALTGDTGRFGNMLSSLKGKFASVKGAAATAASVIAGVAVGMELVSEAAKQLTEDVTKLTDKSKTLNTAYDSTRDSVQDLAETIDQYSTTAEKREAIEQKIAEVQETQRAANRNLNDGLKDGTAITEAYTEAMTGELDVWGSILDAMTNGAVRMKAAGDAGQALADSYKATGETVVGVNEDLDTLNAMLADVEEEERKAAETVVNSEGKIVAAKDASITKAGEELAAWQNLDADTQTIAQNVAQAVGAMRDSIASSVDSVGNFFDAVAEKEQVHADKMKANFRAQIDEIKNWEENLAFLADKGINKELLQYMADMGPAASNYVQAMADDVLNGSQATVDEWNNLYREKLDLEGAYNEEANDLLTAIGESAAGSKEAFERMAQDLNAATNDQGKYIVAGLVDGINTAMSEAEKAGETLGTKTVDNVALGAEEESPSKATTRAGKFIDQGLINGMNKEKNRVQSTARDIGTLIIKTITALNLQSKMTAEGRKVGAGLVSGINSMKSQATSAARGIGAGIAQALQGQTQTNYNAAMQVMTHIRNAISTGATSAKATAQASINAMMAGISHSINAGATSANAAARNAMSSLMLNIAGSIGSGAAAAQGTAQSAAWQIAAALANGIYAYTGVATAAAYSLAASTAAAAGNADTSAAYWAGYAISHGMASGINAGASAAVNAAAQMAARALQAAKNTLGIRSPSRVFEDEVGAQAAAGLVKGFDTELKIETGDMVKAVKMGLPDISQVPASQPEVRVYLGDRELSAVLYSTVVKQISGATRAYNAAGGRR